MKLLIKTTFSEIFSKLGFDQLNISLLNPIIDLCDTLQVNYSVCPSQEYDSCVEFKIKSQTIDCTEAECKLLLTLVFSFFEYTMEHDFYHPSTSLVISLDQKVESGQYTGDDDE